MIQFESITRPFVDTPEKAQKIANEINQDAQNEFHATHRHRYYR